MKINCVVCKKPQLEMEPREALDFARWLEKEHTLPLCIECTDREQAAIFLAAYAEIRRLWFEQETVEEYEARLRIVFVDGVPHYSCSGLEVT